MSANEVIEINKIKLDGALTILNLNAKMESLESLVVQELISSEDNVHRIEDAQSPAPTPREPKIQNINDINSLENKPAPTIDVEVTTPSPKELITKELMNRGLTQEEAGKWCYGKSDDVFNGYLNDPASIDTILEEIRGL